MLVGYGTPTWHPDIAFGSKLLNLVSFNPCQPVDFERVDEEGHVDGPEQ